MKILYICYSHRFHVIQYIMQYAHDQRREPWPHPQLELIFLQCFFAWRSGSPSVTLTYERKRLSRTKAGWLPQGLRNGNTSVRWCSWTILLLTKGENYCCKIAKIHPHNSYNYLIFIIISSLFIQRYDQQFRSYCSGAIRTERTESWISQWIRASQQSSSISRPWCWVGHNGKLLHTKNQNYCRI